MNTQDPKLTDHRYDDIQEYDNPMPGWWLATFYLTIIFSIIYYGYYQLGSGPTLQDEFKQDVQKIAEITKAQGGSSGPSTDLNAAIAKPEVLAQGAQIYQGKCAACHAADLGGQIGPNLVDNYWIHGKGTPEDVYKVINEGVLDKGMPNWGAQLKSDELVAVTAFVISKKGSQPATPKAPQGELVQ